MTKKTSPIEKHREKDIKLCREELLAIIKDPITNATALRAKVDAIKTLGRFHHALQVEKVTAKAEATQIQGQAQQLPPDVKARVDKEIDAVLGRGTAIQDTPTLP